MIDTKVVLLATGTPSYYPGRTHQQASAVIVDDQPYLIDCGDGAMPRIAKAMHQGINALHFSKLTRLFLTHLHPDHTAGLPGLIIGPWVMRRTEPLHIYGPTGTQALVGGILAAYETGIAEHRDGLAPINHPLLVAAHEYTAGEIYHDEQVIVTAFPVDHGTLKVYGLKFVTPNKVIVHSADTCPVPTLIEAAQGCDILIHEVYLEQAMREHFPPAWQTYHSSVHTSELQLAEIANAVQPKLLVLNHQMLWGHYQPADLLASLSQHYAGEVVYGNDLDVFV
jgi:ribonuclease BN (tRNA processing enzyme)